MHHLSDHVEESTDLAVLWRRLCEGRLFMSQNFCEAGRCFALLEARSAPLAASSKYVSLLERLFAGESQKSMAWDLGVSGGTLAGYCNRALSAFMPRQCVSRAPVLVAMAALAARGVALDAARCDAVRDDARWMISVTLPGETFSDRISSAELEVVQLSIQGVSHLDVARARGTSIRTVANQLASAFTKLHVSGRGEVRALAIRELASARTQPPPAMATRPLWQLLASEQRPQLTIASVA